MLPKSIRQAMRAKEHQVTILKSGQYSRFLGQFDSGLTLPERSSMRRLLQIIGLFCKRALYKRLYSAKETCIFKEPTNRSHPIVI